MFDHVAMAALSPDVTAALATLRTKWGSAAPARFGEGRAAGPRDVGEVVGALATVPLRDDDVDLGNRPGDRPSSQPDPARVFSTGFPALDAILGPGGLPRGMGVSLRGDLSSGRTTLALRLAAEAQAAGSIVAWLDLADAFDPVEAIARGVKPEWLVVVTPQDVDEGIAIAGSLLSGRTVDLLVIDLPQRVDGSKASGDNAPGRPRGGSVADRLGRLAALARRAGITVAMLEPPGLTPTIAGAIGEATGVRLELARRSWIRLGRDVVGQRTEVVVARNRAGPPGRRATLRILYADGGERDACLRRDELLSDEGRNPAQWPAQPAELMAPVIPVPGTRTDATPPLLSTAPPPRPHEAAPALRLLAGGSDRPGRPALDRRDGPRRGPERSSARHPARDAARIGAPARAGGDVPRPRSGG
jgi:RecA/RadA recombinase